MVFGGVGSTYVVGFSLKSSFVCVDIVTCTVEEAFCVDRGRSLYSDELFGQVISVCVAIKRGICLVVERE